ncbi:hypothetical protein VZ95_11425, partial [Elstera litoralis]
RLAELGYWKAALSAIEEAVKIRRDLALKRPDAFLPSLAISLVNMTACLVNLDDHSAALSPNEEAVKILRGLADTLPAVFRKELRNSLISLSTVLNALGRPEEAAAAAAEAAGLED